MLGTNMLARSAMMAAGALWLGQIGIAQQRLQVKVDPRFELISVVEML